MQNDPKHSEIATLFAENILAQSERDAVVKDPLVASYLVDLLLRFLHTDQIFAIKDGLGNRVISITEMIAEGDVTLNADSFERERQVHRHIGDFILFWSGMYPEFLRNLRVQVGTDLLCDYPRQAKESYHVVSTFDYSPYDQEAPLYRKLSESLDQCIDCLHSVRQNVFHA